MVFATFHDQAEPLHEYLGPVMLANIWRVLGRPIEVLGTTRQHMRGNWKLYAENTRDSYHGALLHLFYPTFGIYRPAQDSAAVMDEGHRFHNLFQIMNAGDRGDVSEYENKGMRAMPGADSLADTRVIDFLDDYGDGISLTIQSLFPNVVLQQIQNTLATRQIVTRGVADTEVVWTFFGYVGESESMRVHRLRNINLVGPAGFISMEDGEAVEIVQQGLVGATSDAASVLSMGGDSDADLDRLGMDENSIRGFWHGYRQFMRV
jgi:anthranilate 1,2-dioxygenase large subunit